MAENTSKPAAKRVQSRTPAPEATSPPEATMPPATEIPEGTVPYTASVKLDGSEDPGRIVVYVPDDTEDGDVEAFIELELGEQGIDKDRILGFEKVPDAEVEPEATTPPEADEAARQEALNKLANGSDDEDSAVTESVVVEVVANGNVIDLSDSSKSAEYVVLKSLFSIEVHGNYRVARKGDVVKLSKDQAVRGLEKGGLRKA